MSECNCSSCNCADNVGDEEKEMMKQEMIEMHAQLYLDVINKKFVCSTCKQNIECKWAFEPYNAGAADWTECLCAK